MVLKELIYQVNSVVHFFAFYIKCMHFKRPLPTQVILWFQNVTNLFFDTK